MKLGAKILISYLIVFGVGFFFLINWVLGDLRVRYLEGVEESLVDQANIMAAWVNGEMENGRFNPDRLHQIFDRAHENKINAPIYRLTKERVDMQMYITDANGRVVFDSSYAAGRGADYSDWRDVYLTLHGQYGARSTRQNSKDPLSSSLYVAAPIGDPSKPAGVLTVVKPTRNITRFIAFAKFKVIKAGILAACAVAIASLVTTFWLTRPIRRLTQYADDVRNGKRAKLPHLGGSEINDMGQSFERMRQALEGKKYVEQYVQTFTHEIKSPLSAIQGAAELLKEPMPENQRKRFFTNIENETRRIRTIVERLLRLTSLESRQSLGRVKPVSLFAIADSLIEAALPVTDKRNIRLKNDVDAHHRVMGDAFLLEQALSNLLQNAISFSNDNGEIRLMSRMLDHGAQVVVDDRGVGIPDFAEKKIFNRFFSLQRPDTGKKSTGLGLNFVREVAKLHQGDITLKNRPNGGVRAVLFLNPAFPYK